MEPKLANQVAAAQGSPTRLVVNRSRLIERMDTAEQNHRRNQSLPQHIRGASIMLPSVLVSDVAPNT